MPAVSVIVAIYNIEKYLPRALDSLVNQTLRDIEIIAVDDGSTDESPRIADDYAASDRRIKVIHRENGGLSAARNTGLLAATGDYIGYLDGDDFAESAMYEKMFRACRSFGAEMCCVRYRIVTEEGKISSQERYREPEGGWKAPVCFGRDEAITHWLAQEEEILIRNSVWSKLFSRNLVRGLVFAEGHNSEDIMYTTAAMANAAKVAYVDEPLYNYVFGRSGSIMNKDRGERRFRDEIPFLRQQIRYFRERGMEEASDRAAFWFYTQMLYYDLDFRDAGMKEYARRLELQIRPDRKEIRRIYRAPYVTEGDRCRMKLFLVSPPLYSQMSKLYEKWVVPLRKKRQPYRDTNGRADKDQKEE